ncbi:autophagy-related protein 13-like [Halichondria panicea]|uniref:autophagy-related protein 13-like n=1 Tax=Halichondria panicea TaxID=6063 RepID=UPI00312B865C
MSFQEKREFDKFLKFLTAKVVQTVVQSRRGDKIRTRSVPTGNDWFNLSLPDDKQVSAELRRSLEGRLPEQDCPVCLEIIMDTNDGDSLVLETWTLTLDPQSRDISVSVGHSLYPRLSLMLKSVITLSRSTPAYRYSRHLDDGNKFNFRVYCGHPDLPNYERDFKHVKFASTACPYGTISISLSYRSTLTLHGERSISESLLPTQQFSPPKDTEHTSLKRMELPFAEGHYSPINKRQPHHPFSSVLPREIIERQESAGTVQGDDDPVMEGLDSLSVTGEQEGFLLVNVGDIKPAFVARTASDELSELLQACNEETTLDLFSAEGSMNVTAAMELVASHSIKETN